MRVVVTGAGGYLGAAIVGALRRRDHDVLALVRDDQQAASAGASGARTRVLDLRALEMLFEHAYGADAIVHAAYEPANGGAVERRAVDALIEALKGTGNRLVYTSTLALPPGIAAYPAEERPDAAAPPWHWRVANEYRALDGLRRGVAVSVVRPPLAYGRRGGGVVLRGMLRDARERGRVRYVGEGSARWSTVHVDDLADAYAAILETGEAARVYAPSSREHLAQRDLATLVALAVRGRGETEAWPLAEARSLLGEYADAATWDALADPGEAPPEWRPSRAPLRDTLLGDCTEFEGRDVMPLRVSTRSSSGTSRRASCSSNSSITRGSPVS
ncbi:hypothetical protein WPS_26590 [Vulcanimicrobium alpinum]|uniref:NAD-dependent epimerase/dehydratase domain-containing protein n=1 Tax=Vulcanimicrobium alpinum TaxID=3016050 RepID=A0AAN1XXU9_UNVUL|nr:hypothetical protein WPS_26590 [Vulcanimicrobium alpinum]